MKATTEKAAAARQHLGRTAWGGGQNIETPIISHCTHKSPQEPLIEQSHGGLILRFQVQPW